MKRASFIRVLQVLCIALIALAVAPQANAQPQEVIEKSAFVGPETVAVGCGAGLTAGAFSAVLPAVWTLPGQSTLVTLPITLAWAGIGCAVGVVAGLSAVLTQAWLDSFKV